MTATLAHILRHPIKGHGREELASVRLVPGEALPWDRTWAVAHQASHFDPEFPAWAPCGNFQRGARTPAVMVIVARWDEEAGLMTLAHPDLGEVSFDPEGDTAPFLDWVAPISPSDARFAPARVVRAPGRAMTDSDWPSVSVLNLASLADLGRQLGADLSIHRWRGNLWLDGLAPWEEEGWVGKELRIGEALLKVRERIGRCKATSANPDTGEIDVDTLRALRESRDGQIFGVYAEVIQGGEIRPADRVEVL
ncbi:MOSC domain protein [Rubellimicrobium mesophilum DSM 19309]|uniref:MOSC domain protein n=1 Tax=Rubellimicrobium mesophilum DSM 19309 TaxID=442562 RepID=A0A017HRK9_9RHOB|nr:MOSC domain-containing protein [Rubellimicrobium mesophilum]EYD76803.1 MOSC domain protein [Rubellimicrobium mesophilum DSM 19309]